MSSSDITQTLVTKTSALNPINAQTADALGLGVFRGVYCLTGGGG